MKMMADLITQVTKEGKLVLRADAKARMAKMHSHVLIKVRSEDGKTIAEHQRQIECAGSAIFGKMGSPIGEDLVTDLYEQLGNGVPTLLFLAVKKGWRGGFRLHKARLKAVELKLTPDRLLLVPGYYRHEHETIGTWMEIESLDAISHAESTKIIVLSSGREALSVLSYSASVFRVGVIEVPH